MTSQQSQEIAVGVMTNQQPSVGVSPLLTLILPDGSEKVLPMPATGSDGQTRVEVPPISAPNGTLVPLLVCVSVVDGTEYCLRESYLIWNNP